MLNHDHGVADVPQVLERVEQLVVVALVQADAGFVQHVGHADEPAADLCSQADALGLAAGERAALAIQRQVADADVKHEAQARADLTQHGLGNQGSFPGELEVLQPVSGGKHVHGRHFAHAFAPNGNRRGKGIEARALAGRALALVHEAHDPVLDALALAVLKAVLEVVEHAGKLAPVPVPAAVVAGLALEDEFAHAGFELVPGRVHGKARPLAQALQGAAVPACFGPVRPGRNGVLRQGLATVGHGEVYGDFGIGAQAVAGLACAPGRIERKQARLELAHGLFGVVRAEHPRAEHSVVKALALLPRHDADAVAQLQRGFHSLVQARTHLGLEHDAVDDYFHVVLDVLVAGAAFGVDLGQTAVHAGPHETLAHDGGEGVAVFALAPADQGRHQHQLAALGPGHHRVHHLLSALAPHLAPAFGAVRHAHAGK
ncbi:MAG: hypothetical protein HPKKFMNG_02489 [Planctomycetes bacterium]|nr:hypothetical protein [Planctomycetota bacterium]